MRKLPETIGPFDTWKELELVLETLISKHNYRLVASREAYENAGIHSSRHRTLSLRDDKTLRSGGFYTSTMTFKDFKCKFISKSMSFKTLKELP